jgi:hypothetical protein
MRSSIVRRARCAHSSIADPSSVLLGRSLVFFARAGYSTGFKE